ncbi:hypothetical protein BDZ97DRAFT_1862647 [Flammula alnicola]|nr:hypothetical protein BDZ97DRAFT_1862647 [Flammula alnicola]
MPPKPSFKVKISANEKENVSLPSSSTMSFALPGTLAEDKLLRKSQRESSFNSSNVSKTRLSEWDLNVSNAGPLPAQSSTSIAYGMPTPQTPWNLLDIGHTMDLETGVYNDVVGRVGWTASEDCFPL